ncbi:MFS general substrate transporter, partial [Gonapodya prolifera JEL478]
MSNFDNENEAIADKEDKEVALAMQTPDVEDDPKAMQNDVAAVEYSPVAFALLFVGLALAVLLAALDQTILSVAIPAIVTDFQNFSSMSWIITGYLLTATAFIPTYGKAADIFGRKSTILVAIVIFEVGSAICGAATSMNMLIVGRAVAGLGGGGILSLVITIISDIVPLQKRALYQGVIVAVFGLASVAGPLLGGVFTDHINWRWCFYINLPLGGVAIVAVVLLLRLPPGTTSDISKSVKRMDYLGTFLLVLGIVFVLLALSEGGNEFAWDSGFVLGFLFAGVVVLVIFVLVEWKVAVEPVIPLSLFRNRYVAIVFFCSFFNGMSFMPLVNYTPTYFEVVNGDSPVGAGIDTIPLVLALMFSSLFAGVFITATQRYYPLVICGAVFQAVGGGLMYTMNADSNSGQKIGYLILAGIGLGFTLQSLTIAAQAASSDEDLSLVTSNNNFWQQVGGVLGVAIASSVYSTRLTSSLAVLAPNASVDYVKNNPSALRVAPASVIPPDEMGGVIDSYVQGLSYIFLLVVPFAGVLLIGSLFVKRAKLTKPVEMGVA